jgi:hypothetical protein
MGSPFWVTGKKLPFSKLSHTTWEYILNIKVINLYSKNQ